MHQDPAIAARRARGKAPLQREGVIREIIAVMPEVAARLVFALTNEHAPLRDAPNILQLCARLTNDGSPAVKVFAVEQDDAIRTACQQVQDGPKQQSGCWHSPCHESILA